MHGIGSTRRKEGGEGERKLESKETKSPGKKYCIELTTDQSTFHLMTLNTFMKLPEIFPLVKWETSTKLCLTFGTPVAARLLCLWDFPG